ncbi:MAG: HEAT repeat domain-containing protein [Vicinamibacterales bacterium]
MPHGRFSGCATSAASPHLLMLSEDPSGDVRFWSARGLTPPLVSAAGLDLAKVATRLRTMVTDGDRRVRTEALRSLSLYDDDDSVQAVIGALEIAGFLDGGVGG